MEKETKTKNKVSIFETLLTKEICFAVCASINGIGGEKNPLSDYYIICSKTDFQKVKDLRLGFIDENVHEKVIHRDLKISEVEKFKANADIFVKVQHNEYGRIYELENDSFREYLKRLELEVKAKIFCLAYSDIKGVKMNNINEVSTLTLNAQDIQGFLLDLCERYHHYKDLTQIKR